MLKHTWQLLRQSPIRHWLWFALLVNLVFELPGGMNSDSRYATLASLCENQSFQINDYLRYTADWAQAPDGNYYSNKAPGPVFLALPIFWIFDQITVGNGGIPETRNIRRHEVRIPAQRIISFFLQVLPFIYLVALSIQYLASLGVSSAGLQIAGAAMLFGNTASVFMNTFFGHGLAANFILALCLALLRKAPFWVGTFFGWALLCDYGSALLLAPLLCVLWTQNKASDRTHVFLKFVLGGVLPGVLWVAYHQSIFGSPLALPGKFQNPIYVDLAHKNLNLWGILSLPKPEILLKLLVGTQRGLLWTQPWLLFVLVATPWILWKRSTGTSPLKHLSIFLLSSLFLLWIMNGSFGGWHGGHTPGPRYLCFVFPSFGLVLGVIWEKISPKVRWGLTSLVLFSVFFHMIVFSVYRLAPPMPVWLFYKEMLFEHMPHTAWPRLGILLPMLVGVIWVSRPPLSSRRVKRV